MYLDENYIDMEGMEPGEVMIGGRGGAVGPTLEWPKVILPSFEKSFSDWRFFCSPLYQKIVTFSEMSF